MYIVSLQMLTFCFLNSALYPDIIIIIIIIISVPSLKL
jgi:hypothetical protein